MQGNRRYVIKPIKHRVLFCVFTVITSIIISFIIFAVFGNIWGTEFEALSNGNTYLSTGLQMSKEQITKASIIVAIQRILIFLLPTVIHFFAWKILQWKNKCHSGFRLGLRIFLYIETIVLFGYSAFSALHYITAMEYWAKIANPYQNSEIIIFISSIILSWVLNKNVILTDDDSIPSSMFIKK